MCNIARILKLRIYVFQVKIRSKVIIFCVGSLFVSFHLSVHPPPPSLSLSLPLSLPIKQHKTKPIEIFLSGYSILPCYISPLSSVFRDFPFTLLTLQMMQRPFSLLPSPSVLILRHHGNILPSIYLLFHPLSPFSLTSPFHLLFSQQVMTQRAFFPRSVTQTTLLTKRHEESLNLIITSKSVDKETMSLAYTHHFKGRFC